MNVIGIDIGITGAIAVVPEDGTKAWVIDMPAITIERNKKTKRLVDGRGIARELSRLRGETYAFVEAAQASQNMGVVSAFSYGESFGLVVGVLNALGIPVQPARPVVWKRDLGILRRGNQELGRDELRAEGKRMARALARKLYPHIDVCMAKHDGRAEAILIAHWGHEKLEEQCDAA